MASLQPQSTKAYLVLVEGLQAYFSRCTAPEDSLEANDYADPARGVMLRHYSFVSLNTVTLAKMYDPKADGALLTWMNDRYKDRRRFSVTISPVNPDQDGTPIAGAKSLVLTNCQLIRRRLPEVDRQGSGLSMIELELDPQSWAFQ